MSEKDILIACHAQLMEALETMGELEDDEAHADLYWQIKDAANSVCKRLESLQ
ncbi:Unknown protein sequence [Pseudomonas amygdali pv. myricae]|uniref:hypothetical protein n=1 Tax=Pseudomonas amygdali TaxID=47877 RepID=UPI0006CD157E|nr:hypothetical protein [Pseudomonas amygdali]KPB64279.1 Unknown protein sequence [Pseudomonas amygdali pv. myricae]RMT44141.1 hypothetical protein ALP46_01244 [Pseudomonas amygdali pv. myricae]